jgi:hypothetical protein
MAYEFGVGTHATIGKEILFAINYDGGVVSCSQRRYAEEHRGRNLYDEPTLLVAIQFPSPHLIFIVSRPRACQRSIAHVCLLMV